MIRRIRSWRSRVGAVARSHPFLLALIVFLAVAVPGFVRVQQVSDEQGDQGRCLASWADQYTARAERITGINSVTTTAQGAYIHALNITLDDAIRKDQAALARDLPAYEKAAVDYEATAGMSKAAIARDPIPPAPKFQCR